MNKKYLFIALFLISGYLIYQFISKPSVSSEQYLGMRNSMMCTMTKSSDGKDINKQIALVDLETDRPRAIFQSGVASPMKSISNSDTMLVIQLVASGTGSTDTITLYKKSGKFEREAKGSVGGDYSYQASGQCI